MKITRKQVRKLILKEMDMMTMGQIAGGIIMSIASLFLVLGPIALHSLMDGYMRGLFSENELRKMHELSKEDPEKGKQYMEHVLSVKGYRMDSAGIPVHAASNRRSAFYAQDYTKKHGDIDFNED